ncbi:MAG TPA: crossover junction endodeoxyribonuclease RuvC [Puia sp.]|nr:crossover junction endodeoxyribonuclease RuvC [Puia sp.]
MQKRSKIILGIDPGTVIMGYGLIQCTGQEATLLDMGVLRLPTREDSFERLRLIHLKVLELIRRYGPADFAIEAPFFGKNVQSMLKLGRAQGVAIATAMHAGIPVTEYSPKKVKQSITGNGNSEKEQVWKMLQRILQVERELPAYDASDALAVAVCHFFQHRTAELLAGEKETPKKSGAAKAKKAGNWEAFIRLNPDKVRNR